MLVSLPTADFLRAAGEVRVMSPVAQHHRCRRAYAGRVPAARPLSRQRILKTAFDLADRNGLEAVTMRAVAAKLGVEAMSLYHHVPSKKAMLDGLVDLVVQVAALPTGEVSAEEWIRGTAEGLRTVARKHPRLVPVLSRRAIPFADPASALPFEAGLAAFGRAGYDLSGGFAAVQACVVAMLGMMQLEATATLLGDTPDESALEELPEGEFPLLHQVLDNPAGLDDFWAALVEALVDGMHP
jgi:AcrR family transcriptional regulator